MLTGLIAAHWRRSPGSRPESRIAWILSQRFPTPTFYRVPRPRPLQLLHHCLLILDDHHRDHALSLKRLHTAYCSQCLKSYGTKDLNILLILFKAIDGKLQIVTLSIWLLMWMYRPTEKDKMFSKPVPQTLKAGSLRSRISRCVVCMRRPPVRMLPLTSQFQGWRHFLYDLFKPRTSYFAGRFVFL